MSEVIKTALSGGALMGGEGMTYNLIKIFFPFFTGLLVLNSLIAFMNPKLKDYTQGNKSSWEKSLRSYSTIIYAILTFFSGLFIYTVPLFKIGNCIGKSDMSGIYGYLVPVVVLQILLYLLNWFFKSFTKWNYDGPLDFNTDLVDSFKYCKIDETSEHQIADQSVATCKWTKWQAIRDTVCYTFSSFFNSLGFLDNRYLIAGDGKFFYALWFWILLAGILKTIF